MITFIYCFTGIVVGNVLGITEADKVYLRSVFGDLAGGIRTKRLAMSTSQVISNLEKGNDESEEETTIRTRLRVENLSSATLSNPPFVDVR